MHPRFGAVAVGARPFLIAWNINLDTDDVDLAKRIARRVRESGGGLPRLQANGFRVEEPDRGHPVRAQVSMNLLDFRRRPIWQAWDAVRELAGEDGIRSPSRSSSGSPRSRPCSTSPTTRVPRATPTIGTRLAGAAAAIKLRDFDPLMALELRLAAARERPPGRDAPPHRGRSGRAGTPRGC